jgi:hypothetical protein
MLVDHPPPPSHFPCPAIRDFATGSTAVLLSPAFTMLCTGPGGLPCPDPIPAAVARYTQLIFFAGPPAPTTGAPPLNDLTITVTAPTALQWPLDESYTLTVSADSGSAAITANTQWGALRGLESFSQLVVWQVRRPAPRQEGGGELVSSQQAALAPPPPPPNRPGAGPRRPVQRVRHHQRAHRHHGRASLPVARVPDRHELQLPVPGRHQGGAGRHGVRQTERVALVGGGRGGGGGAGMCLHRWLTLPAWRVRVVPRSAPISTGGVVASGGSACAAYGHPCTAPVPAVSRGDTCALHCHRGWPTPPPPPSVSRWGRRPHRQHASRASQPQWWFCRHRCPRPAQPAAAARPVMHAVPRASRSL